MSSRNIAPLGCDQPRALHLGGWSASRPALDVSDRLIASAGHARLSTSQQAEFVTFVHECPSAAWHAVFARAEQRGMASLLWFHLAQQQMEALVPLDAWLAARQAYVDRLLTQMRLAQAQREVLATCHYAGIPIIPRKGPALALRLYDQLGPRPSRDIDFLLHPTVPQRRAFAVLAPVFARWDGQGLRSELTWNLVRQPPHRAAFPARAIWQQARPAAFQGQPCWALAPADEIRYLCSHYVKHGMDRWIWLVDIAELIQQAAHTTAWDWGAFVNTTSAAGLALPVALVVLQAQTLLQTAIPPGILEELLRAAEVPPEQQRWAAITGYWQSEEHRPQHMLRVASWRERVGIAKMLLWPDRAYLYDVDDWSPGQSLVLARLRRLRLFVRSRRPARHSLI